MDGDLTIRDLWRIIWGGWMLKFSPAPGQLFDHKEQAMAISRRALLAAAPLAWAGADRLWAADGDDFSFDEFTKQSGESAERGTQFLMKTMLRDGSCGIDIGQSPDIGCTAMVGLALLAQGNTQVEGPRCREVRKIVNYMLKCVDHMPSDDITSATTTQLQNKIGRHAHTFFATLFLSQVMGEGYDPDAIRPKLGKLVSTVCKMQTSDGDWSGNSWAPTLGTVMGWSCLMGRSTPASPWRPTPTRWPITSSSQ